VSQELNRTAKAKPGQPEPHCCVDDGFFWDEAILYAPHTQWKDMPVATFWNGPVYKIIPGLETAVRN
jgi:hypothetical protein